MSDAAPVLVVEDEVPLRTFLRATLTSHGFRVIEAASEPGVGYRLRA